MQNVTNQFSKIAQDPRVAFFGNVTVGRDVSYQEIKQLYHAVSTACVKFGVLCRSSCDACCLAAMLITLIMLLHTGLQLQGMICPLYSHKVQSLLAGRLNQDSMILRRWYSPMVLRVIVSSTSQGRCVVACCSGGSEARSLSAPLSCAVTSKRLLSSSEMLMRKMHGRHEAMELDCQAAVCWLLPCYACYAGQ